MFTYSKEVEYIFKEKSEVMHGSEVESIEFIKVLRM